MRDFDELVLFLIITAGAMFWLYRVHLRRKRKAAEAWAKWEVEHEQAIVSQQCQCLAGQDTRADGHSEHCPKRIWLERTTFARLDPAPWEPTFTVNLSARERGRIERYMQRGFWPYFKMRRSLLLTELGYVAARQRWPAEKRAKYSLVAKRMWAEENPGQPE